MDREKQSRWLGGIWRGVRVHRALVIALLVSLSGAAAVQAATISSKTSQHQRITIVLSRGGRLSSLIVGVNAACTNGAKKNFWPGFVAPFKHPQDVSGHVADAYRLTSIDGTFRETARFSAHVTASRVAGRSEGRTRSSPPELYARAPA